ncbi:MAG: hypothetical protein AB9M60_02555 [Leptothrix sp. (in: b-proteobacteria)]
MARIETTPPQRLKRVAALAALTALAGLTALAQAHDLSLDPLPSTPGWRVGAAAAVTATRASDPWPATRWPGVPGSGQTPSDRRGLGLEHATVDAAAAFGDRHGAYLALGRHGQDPGHLEAARIESRWRFGLDTLALQLGRDRVPMGGLLTAAGHFDRHGQAPLVKRAVLNDDWISDGVNLRWTRGVAEGVQGVDLGLWRARTYPGGLSGRPAPAAHLQAAWGHLSVDGFAAFLSPQSRGTPAVGNAAGHSHSQPDCRRSLAAITCFDGRTRVLGASASWDSEDLPLRLSAAGLLQHDDGELYSARGQANDRANIRGGWVDAQWRWSREWQSSLRAERLMAEHQLIGIGASLVAADAGLVGNRPINRLSAAVQWQLTPALQLGLDAGAERSGLPANRWIGLRAIWSDMNLLAGDW